MIEYMFNLLKKCFFLGFDFDDDNNNIISEEEEIYIREKNPKLS
jgi:hypothetical protein